MKVGDLVVRKSYSKDITFKIIDIKENEEGITYILKGLHIRIIADSKGEDLEKVEDDFAGDKDKSFDSKMNDIIKKVILSREQKNNQLMTRGSEEDNLKRTEKEKGLVFGRPGRILHIDGDPSYMETCLKAYKQLNLNAVGIAVSEREQPLKILSLVKEYNPDIVVLTGHDELVIFAGACQSCYESILEAGANFASSPNRVLIHCLDPVLVCERVAYTRIDEIVSIKDVIENTITGIKGVGGLQTRGKYREGYPKSLYLN